MMIFEGVIYPPCISESYEEDEEEDLEYEVDEARKHLSTTQRKKGAKRRKTAAYKRAKKKYAKKRKRPGYKPNKKLSKASKKSARYRRTY